MTTDQQLVVILDAETTGTDAETEQIVELTCREGLHDGAESKTWLIKPDVEISADVVAIHGITAEDVADCPRFAEVADEIEAVLRKADVLVGYNVDFDLQFLKHEFKRMGRDTKFLSDALVVDAMELWIKKESRSLESAYRRFIGKPMENAHRSRGDVDATCAVLTGLMEEFELKGTSWAELQDVCFPERARWIGSSHHVQWDDNGVAVLAFGKRHNGRPLLEVAEQERSYLEWILRENFPRDVQDIVRGALKGMPAEEFYQRLAAYYGGPKEK